MTVTAVGLVVDALVDAAAAAPDLSDVTVCDGYGDWSGNLGDFLLIGVEDPDGQAAADSADAQQEWAHVGHTTRDETGTVTCAAWARNGDTGSGRNGDGSLFGQRAARARVVRLAAELGRLCRQDPTLGVDCLLWSGFGSSIALTQDQYDEGSSALLIFQVAYRARLTSDGD